MATVKAVSSGKGTIRKIIRYVSQDEKGAIISGYNCSSNLDICETQMMMTKESFNKLGGRNYKHYVQSFHKDENISPQQAHEIAMQLVERIPKFKEYEILLATHTDKEHIHTHFIVNTVNFVNGKKYQESKEELQNMKDVSDELCISLGLSVTQKGKDFYGKDLLAPQIYDRNTYRVVMNHEESRTISSGEQVTDKSYIVSAATALVKAKAAATSISQFCEMMKKAGYTTEWQENKKHVVFIDNNRVTKGNKKSKIRLSRIAKYLNLDITKESLAYEIQRNSINNNISAGRNGTTEQPPARIESTTSRSEAIKREIEYRKSRAIEVSRRQQEEQRQLSETIDRIRQRQENKSRSKAKVRSVPKRSYGKDRDFGI